MWDASFNVIISLFEFIFNYNWMDEREGVDSGWQWLMCSILHGRLEKKIGQAQQEVGNHITIFGGFRPLILISELFIYSRSLANQILTNFAFWNVKIRPMVQKLASKEDEAYILLKFEMYVYEIILLQGYIKHI